MICTAVIGAGSFGEKRAIAIKSCAGAQLSAVSDVDLNRADFVAKKVGTVAMSVEELYADSTIDAVIVAVPNKYHTEIVVKALEHGKHVVCEKPLARNVAEARQMVDAADRTGRFLKTGSNHRYFASVMKARELVDAGTIGEIISFNGRIGNSGDRIQDTWFWDKDMSGGGTLLDNGCHLLDIARWFLGDFTRATGITTRAYWKRCSVEDSATGVFVTEKGQIATINSSWRQLSGYLHFELNGSEGYITVDGRFDTHGGDVIYWQTNNGKGEIFSQNFGHVRPNSYVLELEDFFESIAGGRQPLPSGEDGLKVIQMVSAVYNNGCRDLIHN